MSKIAKGLLVSTVPPPLLGFNNNVRHRGRVFHIQTEDSGVKSPRIVTHLFADGGRIIRTTRTEYTEHVARADLQPFLRGLMKEQHKGMFMALRLGELDTLLEDVCGPFEQPLSASKAPPPPIFSSPPEPSAETELPLSERGPANVPRSERAAADLDALGVTPSGSGFVSATGSGERSERTSDRPEAARTLINPNLRKVAPSAPPSSVAAFELDVAALESLSANPPPSFAEPAPASAPPSSASLRTLRKSNPPPPRKLRPTLPSVPPLPAPSSRPSARFSTAAPKPPPSIFGEGVISEQSLDEVILSYLAEELDTSE